MNTPKKIGIAVVQHLGRYLVGERESGVPLAGFAEFPGGKCLLNESPIECAVRECLEESGLAVVPDRLLLRREFEYPHGFVDLHFVLCHPANAAEVQSHHLTFRWCDLNELSRLKFPEANQELISLLE